MYRIGNNEHLFDICSPRTEAEIGVLRAVRPTLPPSNEEAQTEYQEDG